MNTTTATVATVVGTTVGTAVTAPVTGVSPAGATLVIAPSESELAPRPAAWDHAHRAATDDPEWRHLLDEMAHPRTTQAFHRLAAAGG